MQSTNYILGWIVILKLFGLFSACDECKNLVSLTDVNTRRKATDTFVTTTNSKNDAFSDRIRDKRVTGNSQSGGCCDNCSPLTMRIILVADLLLGRFDLS